jgi:hypothetical protein
MPIVTSGLVNGLSPPLLPHQTGLLVLWIRRRVLAVPQSHTLVPVPSIRLTRASFS